MLEQGSLFVIATPIGNLNDITLRALEVIKSCDLLLSEDTRETKKLLDKFNIEKQQISYRDENHNKVIEDIIELLNTGNNIGLVSDSGTPLISDPGFKLISKLKKEGFKVITIPGPSAVISALSICGLPTDKFLFLGFLPKKESQIMKALDEISDIDATVVIYESPYRVRKLLELINSKLGDRIISICRELTKVHEEVITGNVSEILQTEFKEKGEFVVLIAKKGFKYD